MTTPEQRAAACDQALANTRIEGHQPTPEFLEDCAQYVAGTSTVEELVEKARQRALQLQDRVAGSGDDRS